MIVVDASVVFAATIRDGRTREALLTCRETLIAPPVIWDEIERLVPRMTSFANAPQAIVRSFIEAVNMEVRTIPASEYAHMRPAARRACEDAQAWDDDEYVALAMAFKAPIWTLDRDFERVGGIEVVVGRDLWE